MFKRFVGRTAANGGGTSARRSMYSFSPYSYLKDERIAAELQRKEEEEYWESERLRLEEEQKKKWEEEEHDRNKDRREFGDQKNDDEEFDASFAVIYNNLVTVGEKLRQEKEHREKASVVTVMTRNRMKSMFKILKRLKIT